MKYLCLVFNEEKKLAALSEREARAFEAAQHAYDAQLRRRGQLIAAAALQPVQAATTVRLRNGRLSLTDGPFAPTKEQLGGFFLIEARDLNEAVQLAARMPSARTGCVEVRPIRDLARTTPREGRGNNE